jgi:hypothetical protein
LLESRLRSSPASIEVCWSWRGVRDIIARVSEGIKSVPGLVGGALLGFSSSLAAELESARVVHCDTKATSTDSERRIAPMEEHMVSWAMAAIDGQRVVPYHRRQLFDITSLGAQGSQCGIHVVWDLHSDAPRNDIHPIR